MLFFKYILDLIISFKTSFQIFIKKKSQIIYVKNLRLVKFAIKHIHTYIHTRTHTRTYLITAYLVLIFLFQIERNSSLEVIK